MDNIVKYHNDLNKLKFYLFGELEQNILMGVFLNARFHNTKEFILNADDIAKFLPQRNPSKQEIFNRVMSLRENLFKIDYTHEIKLDNGLIELSFYNIFSVFTLVYTTENREFEYLKIKISDDFSYLIHNLTKHFTQFELEEFLFLRGKYPKILYRLLKQFRLTGYFIATWEKFKEKMGIPLDMRNATIEKQILKPCVEKLSQTMKTHLFDARIPFENLKYKLKKESSKRGKPKVTHIEFYFKPQEPSCLDERQKYINEQKAKKPIVEPNEPRYITELKELCQKHKKYKVGDDIHELIKVVKNDNGDYELYYKRNNETLVAPLTYEKAQKYLKAPKED